MTAMTFRWSQWSIGTVSSLAMNVDCCEFHDSGKPTGGQIPAPKEENTAKAVNSFQFIW